MSKVTAGQIFKEVAQGTLTKEIDYVEQGTKKYEEELRQKEKATLYRLAKKHNMQVYENQRAA